MVLCTYVCMSVCGYVYTCMCAAKMKYYNGKYLYLSTMLCIDRHNNMIVGFVGSMQY